jgi:hypothetical protein
MVSPDLIGDWPNHVSRRVLVTVALTRRAMTGRCLPGRNSSQAHTFRQLHDIRTEDQHGMGSIPPDAALTANAQTADVGFRRETT